MTGATRRRFGVLLAPSRWFVRRTALCSRRQTHWNPIEITFRSDQIRSDRDWTRARERARARESLHESEAAKLYHLLSVILSCLQDDKNNNKKQKISNSHTVQSKDCRKEKEKEGGKKEDRKKYKKKLIRT